MNQLLKDIEKLRSNWNERSMFRLKGVKNLSVADLDTLEMYAKSGVRDLMIPRGDIAKVLKAYGFDC